MVRLLVLCVILTSGSATVLKSLIRTARNLQTSKENENCLTSSDIACTDCEVVNLSNYGIQCVSPSAFSRMKNMKKLYLNNNSIQTFPYTEEFESLEQLEIGGNPLKCDSEAKPLQESAIIRKCNPPETLICTTPAKLFGKSLFDVVLDESEDPESNSSEDSGRNTGAIAAAVVLFILAIGIGLANLCWFIISNKPVVDSFVGSNL